MSLRFDNKTKYIDYTFSDAPSIATGYGSFVNILSKVLSKGINFNTPTSIEILEQGLVRIHFEVSPEFPVNSIIKIDGIGDVRLDGDHRVMKASQDFVEIYLKTYTEPFSIPEDLSAVSVCIAPLGYDQVYTNEAESIMCFKNKSKNYPAILKVIDELPPNGYETSWAHFARVVVGEEIDEFGEFIDNIKTPYHPDYPDAEKTGNGVAGRPGIHGFAKWRYRITNEVYGRECYGSLYNTSRPWYIIGDDKTFYIIINSGADTSLYGFGNIETTGGGAVALQAADDFLSAESTAEHNSYGKRRSRWGNLNRSNTGSFLLHDIGGAVINRTFRYYSAGYYFGEHEKHTPWKSNEINFHNDNSGIGMLSNLMIRDESGYFRGCHRGIKIMYGSNTLPSGPMVGTNDRCIRVTDPYRSGGSMPIIFSNSDWSSVDDK